MFTYQVLVSDIKGKLLKTIDGKAKTLAAAAAKAEKDLLASHQWLTGVSKVVITVNAPDDPQPAKSA